MSTHVPDDDPLATRLHDALDSEAAMVTPSDDGLQRIRAGIDVAHRPWWRHPATIAVAAAVVLGTAVGIGAAVLGGGNGGTVVATDSTTPSAATSTPGPTTASVQPEPQDPPMTGTPRPAGDTGVYVYFLADGKGSAPRLFREIQPSTGADPAAQALTATLAGNPQDPDYYSPWAGARALSYSVQGDTATVDLSRFVQTGGVVENVAVQQLVYTITANDTSVKKVKLLVDGATPPNSHHDWSNPVARAPMLDVQGLIWLTAPTQGQTVSSPVQITGYGTAFEGTISWEVRQNGAKVAEGHTQGGSNGQFGDFSDTVDLPPGTYEIRAFESSAKDGSPQHIDTKTFTVR
jgi:hypothetical protein